MAIVCGFVIYYDDFKFQLVKVGERCSWLIQVVYMVFHQYSHAVSSAVCLGSCVSPMKLFVLVVVLVVVGGDSLLGEVEIVVAVAF